MNYRDDKNLRTPKNWTFFQEIPDQNIIYSDSLLESLRLNLDPFELGDVVGLYFTFQLNDLDYDQNIVESWLIVHGTYAEAYEAFCGTSPLSWRVSDLEQQEIFYRMGVLSMGIIYRNDPENPKIVELECFITEVRPFSLERYHLYDTDHVYFAREYDLEFDDPVFGILPNNFWIGTESGDCSFDYEDFDYDIKLQPEKDFSSGTGRIMGNEILDYTEDNELDYLGADVEMANDEWDEGDYFMTEEFEDCPDDDVERDDDLDEEEPYFEDE